MARGRKRRAADPEAAVARGNEKSAKEASGRSKPRVVVEPVDEMELRRLLAVQQDQRRRAAASAFEAAAAAAATVPATAAPAVADRPGDQEEEPAQQLQQQKHKPPQQQQLQQYWRPLFESWRQQLLAGHSLLLHGYGDKRQLLQQFAAFCREGPGEARGPQGSTHLGFETLMLVGGERGLGNLTAKKLSVLIADALQKRAAGRGESQGGPAGESHASREQQGPLPVGAATERQAADRQARLDRRRQGQQGAAKGTAGAPAGSSAAVEKASEPIGDAVSTAGEGGEEASARRPPVISAPLQAELMSCRSGSSLACCPVALRARPLGAGGSTPHGEQPSAVGGSRAGGGVSCLGRPRRMAGTLADRIRLLAEEVAAGGATGMAEEEHHGGEEGSDRDDGEEEGEEDGEEGEVGEGKVAGRVQGGQRSVIGQGLRRKGGGRLSNAAGEGAGQRWPGSAGGPGSPPPLLVVAHGLDRPPLCSAEPLSLLAALAAHGVLRVAAAVDSVLAAAVFDQQLLCQFNFASHHVATCEPYDIDSSSLPLLRRAASSSSSLLAAARAVLQTLPPNAREVFRLVAEAARGSSGSGSAGPAKGLSFAQLYSRCRARFLVSNEVTLRAHLRELVDHQLLRGGAGGAGSEGGEGIAVALAEDAVEALLAEL